MAASFAGKCALVTGGTKGMGKAIVEAFAALDARVFTCARNGDELNQKLGEWKGKGFDVQGAVCDVSDDNALKQLVQKAGTAFDGKLHALVNNAAFNKRVKALDYDDELYYKMFATNVRPAFSLSRLCHPMLKSVGKSSIVYIGSIAGGPRANNTGCVMGMTKAAVGQLTRSLACEWAPDGIRVNCVSPGHMDTPMAKTLHANKEKFAQILAATPLKRDGQPEEVADAVVFMCSDRASFVTGQTLFVDGGFTIQGVGWGV